VIKLKGFTLVEVILSLGIFSVAILIIFAVLSPLVSQTGSVQEEAQVNHLVDHIKTVLEKEPYDNLERIFANPENKFILYASRSGDRIISENNLNNELLEENEYFYRISLQGIELPKVISYDSEYLLYDITVSRYIPSQSDQSDVDLTLGNFQASLLSPELRP